MISKSSITKFATVAMLVSVGFAGCKKDDDAEPTPTPTPDPLKTTYVLKTKDVLGVTGTITFAEVSSGSSNSVVTIVLSGAPAGVHPAHIHANSAIETGAIIYPLSDVDASGNSTTTLNVSYNTLINFDGYANVHLDALTLGTIIAQADIGGNALTATNITYTLAQDSTSGVSGWARFDKRKNGNTLVTVDLTSGGILPAGSYPAQINLGSIGTVGTPVKTKTLTPVDGILRTSQTNIRKLDDNNTITYDNWLVYDGFLTIHDAANVTNVIAQGNIGSN
jgi:hypothetical protein